MIVPQTIQVASIGIPDTLFLMLLALVVFGPRRLPEIGRQIGKLMYEFRKVSNDFKFQMEEELRASEEADRLAKLQAASAPPLQQHPILESSNTATPVLELGQGIEGSGVGLGIESEGVPGEVRGEPRKFPPVMPPTSGETIAAQKPFRGRIAEPEAEPQPEVKPEYDGVPSHVLGDSVVEPECEMEVTSEKEQGVHHG